MLVKHSLVATAMIWILTGCGGSSEPQSQTPVASLTSALDLPAIITINSPGLLPEGVEYDTKNNRFLVGSATQGTVFIVANDGSLTPFVQDPELVSSVGIEVDEERNRLLVVNADWAVFQGESPGQAKLGIYDLDTGERIAMIDLGALGPEGARTHFANDVAVADDGSIYVTDSHARAVFRIDPTLTPSVFMPNTWANLDRHFLNGIVYHSSGHLLIAEMAEGKLYLVPVADPSNITEVALPEPLPGADGLVWAPNGDLIVVCNNDSLRAVALRTEDNWASATIAGTASFGTRGTTAATAGDGVYVVHPHLGDREAVPSIERVTFQ